MQEQAFPDTSSRDSSDRDGGLHYSAFGARLEVPAINHLMSIPSEHPEVLSLAAGFTDNAVLPADLVRDVVSRLCGNPSGADCLQYGTTQGRKGLRELTARFVASYHGENAEVIRADRTFITNGSQQALFLAMRVLCDPGDVVLVENPTYFVFLSMLQGMGVQPVGIPVAENGSIDGVALDALMRQMDREGRKGRIKAAYVMGYYANPSSRCLSLEDKMVLAATLRTHGMRIPVIEDAAYRELAFERPWEVPSVLSLDAYEGYPLLYLGTYTKPFATGLKVGYGITNRPEWLEKMLFAKGNQDFGSAHFPQAIVEQVLQDGVYPEFVRNLGLHYGAKARLLDSVLRAEGLDRMGWRWAKPEGGLLFWLRAPAGVDTREGSHFYEACLAKGVIYVPGNLCFADGAPSDYIRLSIGALPNEKLEEAARRLCDAARNL